MSNLKGGVIYYDWHPVRVPENSALRVEHGSGPFACVGREVKIQTTKALSGNIQASVRCATLTLIVLSKGNETRIIKLSEMYFIALCLRPD